MGSQRRVIALENTLGKRVVIGRGACLVSAGVRHVFDGFTFAVSVTGRTEVEALERLEKLIGEIRSMNVE